MSSPDNDSRLLHHTYDGIQEYDNPLPRWWIILFWATIVFAIFYVLNIGVGIGNGRLADYDAEIAAAKLAHPEPEGAATADQLNALAGSTAALAAGKTLFATNCASCHRADAGGLIGPNLTDDAWIHGARPEDIHATIVNGVLAKGMPPWGRILQPVDVDNLTAYVLSLAGSNPPNAKAPEGVPGTR
jgi:cytochrome c oxidase cbb3-type subunit 3